MYSESLLESQLWQIDLVILVHDDCAFVLGQGDCRDQVLHTNLRDPFVKKRRRDRAGRTCKDELDD